MRAVVDGILYLVRTGCAWRMLPRDFPPWSTVHHYYRKWRKNGTIERIHRRCGVRCGSRRAATRAQARA